MLRQLLVGVDPGACIRLVQFKPKTTLETTLYKPRLKLCELLAFFHTLLLRLHCFRSVENRSSVRLVDVDAYNRVRQLGDLQLEKMLHRFGCGERAELAKKKSLIVAEQFVARFVNSKSIATEIQDSRRDPRPFEHAVDFLIDLLAGDTWKMYSSWQKDVTAGSNFA